VVLSVTSLSPSSDEGRQASFCVYLKRATEDVGASVLRDAALSDPPTSTWDYIARDADGAKTALRQAIHTLNSRSTTAHGWAV
jgi:hypothetical protein